LKIKSGGNLPAFRSIRQRAIRRFVLNYNDGCSGFAHPSRDNVDAFNDARSLKGFVLAGTEAVLNIDDEKSGGHGCALAPND
jgi:hypothetical protein